MPCAVVYVTTESRDEALALGRALVHERLVACANVLDRMTSLFRWKGAVQQAEEAVLLLKTRDSLVPHVITRVQDLHSYDVPCIVSWQIDAGSPEFLSWIVSETADATPPPTA